MKEKHILFDIRKELGLVEANDALKAYAKDFEQAFSLDEKFDIFLDTNVLLSYYGMAAKEKEKLLGFLEKNKNRIFLTAQVQHEIRKNRVKRTEIDLFQPLERIPKELSATRKQIVDKFSSFLEVNKKLISNDYPEEWNELENVMSDLKVAISFDGVQKRLSSKIEETIQNYKHIKFQDDLMNTCSLMNQLPPLNDEYVQQIKVLFNELADVAFVTNSDKKDKPPESNVMFPGAGDYKKKKDPYGDFIIYHEMLNYVHKNGKSVIFLTNEKTKGDWLDKDLSAFVHYVEHSHKLTNQNIYILNAEKPLSVSLANIHSQSNQLDISNIAQMSFDEQIDLIKEWFLENYESPESAGLLFNKQANDFVYLWGEPLSTEEILEEEFYDITSLRVIEKCVSELEDEQDIKLWIEKNQNKHIALDVHRDFSACEDVGASGMFQIIGVSDQEGNDLSFLIDSGQMYRDTNEIYEILESALNAEVDIDFQ
jgi:predicted nucleic acid-binding protein